MPRRHLSIGIMALLAAWSCRPVDSTSRVKLVNGVIVEEGKLVAAVQIKAMAADNRSFGSCTASWVGHNTVLTAAHCVVDKDGVRPITIQSGLGLSKNAASVKVFPHPKYTDGKINDDIALVLFPDQTIDAAQAAGLATVEPKVGDAISIVGFGKFDHADEASGGGKRFGTNKITAIGATVDFEGVTAPTTQEQKDANGDRRSGTGSDVLNSQGDSGGPMMLGTDANVMGGIIGVSSTVDAPEQPRARLSGHYTYVLNPEYVTWMKELVLSDKLSIKGLDGAKGGGEGGGGGGSGSGRGGGSGSSGGKVAPPGGGGKVTPGGGKVPPGGGKLPPGGGRGGGGGGGGKVVPPGGASGGSGSGGGSVIPQGSGGSVLPPGSGSELAPPPTAPEPSGGTVLESEPSGTPFFPDDSGLGSFELGSESKDPTL